MCWPWDKEAPPVTASNYQRERSPESALSSAQNFNSAIITPSNRFVYVCAQYQSNDGVKYEVVPYKVTGSGTGVQLASETPAQTPATNAFNLVVSPNGNFLYALTDTGVYRLSN